jgi:hypothetical protein
LFRARDGRAIDIPRIKLAARCDILKMAAKPVWAKRMARSVALKIIPRANFADFIRSRIRVSRKYPLETRAQARGTCRAKYLLSRPR